MLVGTSFKKQCVMKVFKIFMLVASLPMMACVNGENTPITTVGEDTLLVKPSGELARSYVESNDFIDVDVKSIEYSAINPASSRSQRVSEEDLAKMVAGIYRFYKHVSVIDGLYSCSLKSGAEINVSEDMFISMLNNLEDMNRFIKRAKAKGETVHVMEPTEEYFESLLE